MREVVTGHANRGVWAVALLTAAVIVLAFAAPAFASSSPAPAASPAAVDASGSAAPTAAAVPDPGSSATSEPVPATLTATLSAASVVFGGQVTVTGVLDPVAEGEEVVVTLNGAEVGRAVTDESGAFEVAFTPRQPSIIAMIPNSTIMVRNGSWRPTI